MISYFDTSVLLPVLVSTHPNHDRCKEVFEKALIKGQAVTTTCHTYGELYSNLTRLPKGHRIPPKIAAGTIIEYLGEILEIIDLDKNDYEAALQRCAEKELVSGVIYDALHVQAAIKAEVDVLYTANLRDFERLWDKNLKFTLRSV